MGHEYHGVMTRPVEAFGQDCGWLDVHFMWLPRSRGSKEAEGDRGRDGNLGTYVRYARVNAARRVHVAARPGEQPPHQLRTDAWGVSPTLW